MGKQKDALWKNVVEDLFEDFLLFINPDLAKDVDPDKGYEFINTELNQKVPSENGKYEQRTVDTLVKVYTQQNPVLLHLEVQDKYSASFNQRMYNYFNRLYDKYKMPIVAYAIFIEPNEIERIGKFNLDYMGTRLSYKFNIRKIAEMTDSYLINHSSCFALVILIAKAILLKGIGKNVMEYDKKLLVYKLKIAKLIIQRELPGAKKAILFNFLIFYINFENSLTYTKFENEINLLTKKNISYMTFKETLQQEFKREGYEEGLEVGISKV